jgi:hypothetical protein
VSSRTLSEEERDLIDSQYLKNIQDLILCPVHEALPVMKALTVEYLGRVREENFLDHVEVDVSPSSPLDPSVVQIILIAKDDVGREMLKTPTEHPQ